MMSNPKQSENGKLQHLIHDLRVHQIELEMQNEELRKTQQELEASRDRYADLYDFAPIGYLTLDARGRTLSINLTASRMLGDLQNSLFEKPFVAQLCETESKAFYEHLRDVFGSRNKVVNELKLKGGHWPDRYVRLESIAAQDAEGRHTLCRTAMIDISDRKRAEQALVEEKERAQVTLHSIGDAVLCTDAAGHIEYLNPVAERLTGWGSIEARTQPLEQVFRIINEETRARVENPVIQCLLKGCLRGLANHTILVNRAGREYAIEDSVSPIRTKDGALLGAVLVFKDVTEARRLSREMTYAAAHDALTGLINRREFEHRMRRVLQTARSERTENALCYLDLDQFKLVNDTCGHVAGDELLRQISHLLEASVRQRDTLARLGGDEFGLLMEHCSLDEASRVAEGLIRSVADFRFVWEDKGFNIGVSIGLVPVNEASGRFGRLLSAADAACYMAKEQGRNRMHIYQEDDTELTRRHGEMQWAARLPRALEEDRFLLYIQPIVPVIANDAEVMCYEALLRMQNEKREIVSPGAFLPACERYNLAIKIDRWVIHTLFEWLAKHWSLWFDLPSFSINLSGLSLGDEAFLCYVTEQFKEFDIPGDKICFEITETVAISNLVEARSFIKTLKRIGSRFALDDFGSGLSSFAYLKQLPVDLLKIDGLFVRDILSDSIDLALVKSIHDIGKIMGKQTIAEFVESPAILSKLRDIGVDYAQGYAIGRPRPISVLQ
jgi:diguanylate cyclase (GGDEF)-like protein/PAS domain S-box-containing protein